jgi:hypothetical protein
MQSFDNNYNTRVNNCQHYVLRLMLDVSNVSITEKGNDFRKNTSTSLYTLILTEIVHLQLIFTLLRSLWSDGWSFGQDDLLSIGISSTIALLLSKVWVGTTEIKSPFQLWPLDAFHWLGFLRFQFYWWQCLGYDDAERTSFFVLAESRTVQSLLLFWLLMRYGGGSFNQDLQLTLRHPGSKDRFVAQWSWEHLSATLSIVSSTLVISLGSLFYAGLGTYMGPLLIWLCPLLLWLR